MNYPECILSDLVELSGLVSGPDGPIVGCVTFAQSGFTHSRYGLILDLSSGGRVWCQLAWSGPVPHAPVPGWPGPAPPWWSPIGPDRLVSTVWLEEFLAHLLGKALPGAAIARHSTSPGLGGAQELGVQAMDAQRRVFLMLPWMLRAGEEPHPASRYRYRATV